MHNKSIQTLIVITILILTACSSISSNSALVGEWKLISYGPKDSPIAAAGDSKNSITLSKDGNLSGNVGCNSFSGTFSATNNQIKFGAIASTMMACPDPIMQQESTILKVFDGTTNFSLASGLLTISNGESMVSFEKLK